MIVSEDEDVAKAMHDAQQTCSAMAVAFDAVMRSQPDGSVTMVGAATGVAKLAGLILERISDDESRMAAVVGAIVTLLASANCDSEVALERAQETMRAYSLATTEEAGHA